MTPWVCASCGGENAEGMRFCGHCGTARAAAAPVEAPAPPRAATMESATETLRSFVASPVADRLVESGGHLAEERRLITALFADISGFTSLAERVDTEELLEIIDPIVARLSAIVGRYEGYVEKFAGDALLALFGAPVTHEDDATRALLVALEMQQEIARVRDELPAGAEGLTLHVGVNSGHGIARVMGSAARLDYGVLGDSVILAQRLESAAPPGEIYVGEVTYALTQRRFEFEALGELTVKGKAAPVAAWRLLGERAYHSEASTATSGSPSLLGRERELARLSRVLDHLLLRGGGVVSVTGEAGVGKSSLVAALRNLAESRGVRWLEARCLSYGSALAYRPIADLLRHFAGVRSDSAADEARVAVLTALASVGAADAAPFVARLLGVAETGGSGDAVANLEPEAFQRGLHAAVGAWLRAVGQSGPVIVFVEDVHWIDPSSLALLGDLMEATSGHPILLVATARTDADDPLAPLAATTRPGGHDAIALGPLDADAVGGLIAVMLGGGPPAAELVDVLVERTGGNPFFVEEVVRGLTEAGAIRSSDAGWALAAGWDAASVPATVEGVLAARLDRLPPRAATVLQTGAVIGRRLRPDLLRGILADEPALEEALDTLVRGGFLDRVPVDGSEELRFHHALVQDVAYERLLRRNRRELHLRVAAVAEDLYGTGDDSIDLLARHLYLGGAGAKAVEYLERAGERARRLFANDEAILDYARAAEVAGPLAATDTAMADRLVELRLKVADLHELTGRYAEALAAFRDVAETAGDLRAWRGVAAVHRLQGNYDAALAAVDRALAQVSAGERPVRPLLLERARTLSLEGRLSEAIRAVEAGFEASPVRDGDRASLLLQLARISNVSGDSATALAHANEAAQIFLETGDGRGRATAEWVAGDTLRRLHRLDEAAERLVAGLVTAERVGSAEEIGACLVNLGMVESDRERFEAASDAFDRASAEFRRSGNRMGEVLASSNLADLLVRSGEVGRGRQVATVTLALAREIGNYPIAADVLDTLAQAERADGAWQAEAECWDEASAAYEEIEEWARAVETAEMGAAAWERAGDTERARDRRSRARSLEDRASAAHP